VQPQPLLKQRWLTLTLHPPGGEQVASAAAAALAAANAAAADAGVAGAGAEGEAGAAEGEADVLTGMGLTVEEAASAAEKVQAIQRGKVSQLEQFRIVRWMRSADHSDLP
jgi:hypothetical protein